MFSNGLLIEARSSRKQLSEEVSLVYVNEQGTREADTEIRSLYEQIIW